MRGCVRFADNVKSLIGEADIILEVGPGKILSSLTKKILKECLSNPAKQKAPVLYNCMRHPMDTTKPDLAALYDAVGTVWCAGSPYADAFDLRKIFGSEFNRVHALPGYSFQRIACWKNPSGAAKPITAAAPAVNNSADGGAEPLSVSDRYFLPSWKRSFANSRTTNSSPSTDSEKTWYLVGTAGAHSATLARNFAKFVGLKSAKNLAGVYTALDLLAPDLEEAFSKKADDGEKKQVPAIVYLDTDCGKDSSWEAFLQFSQMLTGEGSIASSKKNDR